MSNNDQFAKKLGRQGWKSKSERAKPTKLAIKEDTRDELSECLLGHDPNPELIKAMKEANETNDLRKELKLARREVKVWKKRYEKMHDMWWKNVFRSHKDPTTLVELQKQIDKIREDFLH